jgi:hypothetical protein
MRPGERGSLAFLALSVGLLVAILAAAVAADRADAGPGGRAAELVPASALAYARADTADRALERMAPRLPGYATLRARALKSAPVVADLRPYLGDELAGALLDLGGRRGTLVIAEVRDEERARAALDRAARATARYGDVLVRRVGSDAAAIVDGFLVAGPELAVQRSIDAAGGDARSLADLRAFDRALSGVRRPAELYVSRRGLRAAPPGMPRMAASLLDRPGLRGLGVAAGAKGDELRVRVRAVGVTPPGAGAAELAARVPAGAIAMIAGGDAGAFVRAAERAGAPVEAFRTALADQAKLDADQDVLGRLKGFTAWLSAGENAPVIGFAARTKDAKGLREALARLQGPVAGALASDPAAPPVFRTREVAGTDTYSLPVSDGFAPTYAVAGDTAVLATRPDAVEAFLAGGGPRLAIPSKPTGFESLGYFDVRQLLALGERTGLTAEDLQPVRIASAVIQREEDDTTAELFFEIP